MKKVLLLVAFLSTIVYGFSKQFDLITTLESSSESLTIVQALMR